MKIPNKIKIKGIEFDIKFEDLGNDYFGDFNELKKTIRLNTKSCKSYQEVTLIHEIMHIIAKELKEPMVERFAWDLWLILKDNNLLKE